MYRSAARRLLPPALCRRPARLTSTAPFSAPILHHAPFSAGAAENAQTHNQRRNRRATDRPRSRWQEEQTPVLQASLRHGIRLGWTDAAMIAGAREVGISPSVVGSFPRKEASLVELQKQSRIRSLLGAFRKCSFSTGLPTCSRSLSTLVLAQHEGGSIKASSLGAVEAAKHLGKENSVSLLLAGSGPSLQEAATHAASCHPSVSKVLLADSELFSYHLAEPWAKLVYLVQQKGSYSHIIAGSDSFGKNVLPRAAALLDVSPITDVTEISGSSLFVRPTYAGNALSTVSYTGSDPCMLTIRSTSFPVGMVSASVSNDACIENVDLSSFIEDDLVGKSRYISLSSQDTERPDLGNARIVVSGGRALKSPENFKMIEKLAEKLGAAVGATRAAVDAGFVPNELQVGQTGKIVAPDLYMAFGVSGAIQHLAGIRDSKVIVAVNKDGDAPIFQVADYGLVGDLFEVIPELLEKLPKKK